MASSGVRFHPVIASLADLLGRDHVRAACEARAVLSGEDLASLLRLAEEPVDLFPEAFEARLAGKLRDVGKRVVPGLARSAAGATSRKFAEAAKRAQAPLSGLGYYRVGEDGRLYLTAKSEHYHAPLGHGFPGYALIERARLLGIPNATHNNTRGHITRLLEEELIREANGLAPGDGAGMARVLGSRDPTVLNRVLNLETGSLAVEAALKMVLARFYAPQGDAPPPEHAGRVPVILVLGDDDGGLGGNYHGTTLLTQVLRGMWPDLREKWAETFLVRAIRPGDGEALEAAFSELDRGRTKVAALFHEIVMMNYGGRLLAREFLERAYSLCLRHDAPVLVDEIQTCLWSQDLFLFREYGLRPSFVAVGKGFPGGEYPASRILFSAALDALPQFGALVTNGQEELASLAYLVTMRWALENAEVTRRIGDAYEEGLRGLEVRHPRTVKGFQGRRHLAGILFADLALAKAFASRLVEMGIDASAQTYKASCPPVVLTKLPLIAGPEAVRFLLERMEEAIRGLERGSSSAGGKP
jgi:acetylornithine/succinyldiaminopimelate/putrescine aminotransferase